MKIDFYGIRAKPATKLLAEAFGSHEEPALLKAGQGTTYVSGNIILKPAGRADLENWIAEVFNNLSGSDEVRFARPIRSIHGTWVYDGSVAWSFLKGSI